MNQPATDATPTSLKDRLGWRAERRPEPGFAHTLGAAAAAFAVFAIFFVVLEVTSDDATAPGVGFFLVLAVVAFLVGAQLRGPVRSAAVTALVFSVPLVWIFAFVGDGEGGEGTLRAIYILVVVSYLALYLFTWTKGRAILLGLALLLVFSWIVWEVDSGGGAVPFQNQISQNGDTPFGFNGDTFDGGSDDGNTDEQSTAALVIGLVYLGAAAALDRKQLTGAATPFIAVGSIATVAGALALVGDESALAGGLTLAVSGAVVGLVGGLGKDRRLSTWGGVVLVFLGLTIVVADTDSSNLGFAGFFAGLAILIGAAAHFVAPRLKEHVDGDIDAPTTGEGATTA